MASSKTYSNKLMWYFTFSDDDDDDDFGIDDSARFSSFFLFAQTISFYVYCIHLILLILKATALKLWDEPVPFWSFWGDRQQRHNIAFVGYRVPRFFLRHSLAKSSGTNHGHLFLLQDKITKGNFCMRDEPWYWILFALLMALNFERCIHVHLVICNHQLTNFHSLYP